MNKKWSLNRNFDNYNEDIYKYLRKVYLNSLDYYVENYINKYPTGTKKLDLDVLDKSIRYLEDYMYYVLKVYSDDFVNVFNSLKRNVKTMTVLSKNQRGLYGQFIPFNGVILINPELKGNGVLNNKERTRLYVCHELGHAVHFDWIHTLGKNIPKDKDGLLPLIYKGFDLIDEATTQNMAEDIAYCFANKDRPALRECRGLLFSGGSYKSNFDFYGNLQESATMFSRTLRGIGKVKDDNTALGLLSKRALNKNFVNDIVYEYTKDGHINDLHYLMTYFGIIKRASYATFGYDDSKYIDMSGQALNEAKKLAHDLRDYRDPFVR